MMNPVLCISRSAIDEQITIPKEPSNSPYHFDMGAIAPEDFQFIHRKVVDGKSYEDFQVGQRFPQVLPYVLIMCEDEILTYSRAKGAEDRLHGSLSCGFGGHVDLRDINPDNFSLNTGILRELEEELNLKSSSGFIFNEEYVLLMDSTNEVGKVHAGYVYTVDLTSKDQINPDPSEIHLPEWKTREDILKEIDRYENWSQTLINFLN